MKCIIEAGSSKTDIAIIAPDNQLLQKLEYKGLNPTTDQEYNRKFDQLLASLSSHPFQELFYYGAGVINQNLKDRISKIIKSIFPNLIKLIIEDDLLGAGRGAFHNKKGIIGILGTGSNVGIYNGQLIVQKVKSCGYLLGDEGSGFRLGQAIYRRFARGQLDAKVMAIIEDQYALTPNDAIFTLYQQSNPRFFLASFAKLIHELDESERSKILNEVFDPFIERILIPLYSKEQLPVSLVGSIAFHFQNILKEKFRKSNIIARSFIQSPIEGLIKYHAYE